MRTSKPLPNISLSLHLSLSGGWGLQGSVDKGAVQIGVDAQLA